MPNNYRPRLPDYFESYIDKIKEFSEQELQSFFHESASKKEWEQSEDGARFEYVGTKSLRTVAEAIEFCKADMDVWEIDRHIFNSWDVTMKINDVPTTKTNYQVKLFFKKRDNTFKKLCESLKSDLKKLKKFKVKKSDGRGTGIASISDIHTGAEILDLVKTKDFTTEVLIKYLQNAAERINSHNYKEVHLNLLGDLVESVSGLNHPNTWKSLGKNMYGHNVIILAYKLIKSHLLEKINNLASVNVVPGNHDRFTIDSKVDNVGGVAGLLSFMLTENTDLKIRYNDLVLSYEVDGINYIITHGHHSMSKNDVKLILDYGNSDLFNVSLKGHWHTRVAKKTAKKTPIEYQDVKMINLDELKYRCFVAPSIFTGNFFSESLGHTSSAGVLIIENNGRGGIHAYDYTLS